MESFHAVAKDADLSQAQAQKLVDYHVAQKQADSDAQWDTWNTHQQEQRDATKADPEVGGDKLTATLANVGKFVNKFGNDGFIKALDDTGAGNNPDVIRVLARAGALLAEDQITQGSPRPAEQTHADILFGKPDS